MAYTSRYSGQQIDSAIGTIVNGYFRSYPVTTDNWTGSNRPYTYTTSGQSGAEDYPYNANTFYKAYFVKDGDGDIFDVDYEIDDTHMKIYSNTKISGTLYVSAMR